MGMDRRKAEKVYGKERKWDWPLELLWKCEQNCQYVCIILTSLQNCPHACIILTDSMGPALVSLFSVWGHGGSGVGVTVEVGSA